MSPKSFISRLQPPLKRITLDPETVSLCLFVGAQYGYEGRVPMRSARLFYDISERARRIVESYFLLNSTLHFSYTHLVCRTAITGRSRTQTRLLSTSVTQYWKDRVCIHS